MRGLFVTGTDTSVGKTILSASLLAAMAADGEPVRAHKPVVTGLDVTGVDLTRLDGRPQHDRSSEWPSDDELLGAAAGMAPAEVAPLRYGPAVSPHLAAQLAGVRITPSRLLAAATGGSRATATAAGADASVAADREAWVAAGADHETRTLIVEGVGGLLTPLTEDFTVRDFAAALEMPVLIAARPGLGTINHTLLTLQAARAAGLDVRAVVLTPWPHEPSRLERSNRETIARLGAVEVEILSRVHRPDPADLTRAGASLPWRRWLQ